MTNGGFLGDVRLILDRDGDPIRAVALASSNARFSIAEDPFALNSRRGGFFPLMPCCSASAALLLEASASASASALTRSASALTRSTSAFANSASARAASAFTISASARALVAVTTKVVALFFSTSFISGSGSQARTGVSNGAPCTTASGRAGDDLDRIK